MLNFITSACVLLLSLIHILPAIGVLGSARLASLYGVSIDEPNLLLLMRHRAVLFGLIGGVLLYSVFKAEIQGIALLLAWLSVVSFLVLAALGGGYNAEVSKIVFVDKLALMVLLCGSLAFLFSSK